MDRLTLDPSAFLAPGLRPSDSLASPRGPPESAVVIRRGTTSDSLRLSVLTKRFFPYIHVSADHVFDRIQSGVVYFVLEKSEKKEDVEKNENREENAIQLPSAQPSHVGELAGFVDFEFNAEPNPRHATSDAPPLENPKTAKILGLCVVPELRGRGWGKKLLKAALDAAQTMGCTQVVMLVEESNEKAIGIYEKAGFKKRGKLVQKIWDKDVLLYVKAL